MFGPNDHFDLEDGHVVAGLIHKAYNATSKSKDVVQLFRKTPIVAGVFRVT